MDIFNLMKDFQKIKAKIEDMKESLKEKTVEGYAGGGMVKVVVTGAQEVVSIDVDDTIWESMDKDTIEDLITAAVNDGLRKSKELVEEEMKRMATEIGIPIPNLLG
ncbi:YbaB/EbfC family nucleoid-associated protein [Thermosulfidibacter takaii]|nr:YbaB/EbfC family nucleoid-associated protein [Thermosulfidibacter takaii]